MITAGPAMRLCPTKIRVCSVAGGSEGNRGRGKGPKQRRREPKALREQNQAAAAGEAGDAEGGNANAQDKRPPPPPGTQCMFSMSCSFHVWPITLLQMPEPHLELMRPVLLPNSHQKLKCIGQAITSLSHICVILTCHMYSDMRPITQHSQQGHFNSQCKGWLQGWASLTHLQLMVLLLENQRPQLGLHLTPHHSKRAASRMSQARQSGGLHILTDRSTSHDLPEATLRVTMNKVTAALSKQ